MIAFDKRSKPRRPVRPALFPGHFCTLREYSREVLGESRNRGHWVFGLFVFDGNGTLITNGPQDRSYSCIIDLFSTVIPGKVGLGVSSYSVRRAPLELRV